MIEKKKNGNEGISDICESKSYRGHPEETATV